MKVVLNLRDYCSNEIQGMFVLYAIKEDAYIVVNNVAKDIWEYLYQAREAVDVEQIVLYIEEKYNCSDKQKVENDITEFIDEFLANNIVLKI